MWTSRIHIMCLVFAIWLDPIDSSSPDDHPPRFPQREKRPIPRSMQHTSSASSSTWSRPSQLADQQSSAAAAEPLLRSRSRSPPVEPPSYSTLFGIKIDDLRFERFFPLNNSSRELVIRMYDFRRGTEIYLKDHTGRISDALTGVKYVLSGVNGDALALVEKREGGYTTLRGLYMPSGRKAIRAKINIFTHQISAIEKEEAIDTPLAKTVFSTYLRRETVNVPVEPFLPAEHTSLSIVTHSKLFGIKMDELPFYRFFPVRNQNLELGIQLYRFSPGEGIHLKSGTRNLDLGKLTGEQYTLSDMEGNAIALVQKTRSNHSIIRGLYVPTRAGGGDRVKINIFTGLVKKMDVDEIYVTPLANNKDTRKWYDMRHVGVKFSPRINSD